MNEIELFFVVQMKGGQVVGAESGPYVDFDPANAHIEKHRYTAEKYRVAKVSLPFELIDPVKYP